MLKGVGPLDSFKMGLVTRNWNFQLQGQLGRGTRLDELPVGFPSGSVGKEWSESHSVVSDFLRPHGLYSPWNSSGQNTRVGSLSLLQGIFPTQESNPGLPHYRQILYQLSYKGRNNWRNANQSCNEVSPHIGQNGHHQKKSTNSKRGCGEKEPSGIVSENVD